MYVSTRNNHAPVRSMEAIKLGMVPAGGLFVPQKIPVWSPKELEALIGQDYQEVAAQVLACYLPDYTATEIRQCLGQAYGPNFTPEKIVALQNLVNNVDIMELWHGPTAAFKDLALQLMPHLLTLALQKLEVQQEMVILVATSGDTGKAALEGFRDVPGLKIICFYPRQGVSLIQERQMLTTAGENTYVVGVQGNFDDCQNAVKALLGEKALRAFLREKGFLLSSANSINWGRLVPQIVYYLYAYLHLVEEQRLSFGEKVNFVVPTGNFGNILAAWYAGQMGVPLHKLICASNENNVLTDFFRTGIYDIRRPFKQTISPSMDILISSNLERFLYELTNHEGEIVATWLQELQNKGYFAVDKEIQEKMSQIMWAGFASESETRQKIKTTFTENHYLFDPHTAVGFQVYQDYVATTGDQTVTVLASTASPFKFARSVLQAWDSPLAVDEFALLEQLSTKTGWPLHPALQNLQEKPILHKRVCTQQAIKQELLSILVG